MGRSVYFYSAAISVFLTACATAIPESTIPIPPTTFVIDQHLVDGESLDNLRPQFSVYFDPENAETSAEASVILAKHARYLNANPQAVILLLAYADDTENTQKNIQIAQQRADTVRRELLNIGVATRRILGIQVQSLRLDDEAFSTQGNRRVDLQYELKPQQRLVN